MNKLEFFKLLRLELETNGVRNVQDILADYEEHFTHGLSKGKSEEEISKNLGSPITIASAYKTDSMIQEIKNAETPFSMKLALNVVMRLLVLAPFNFIVLFIPGVMIFTFLVVGWAVTLGFGGVSLGVLGFLPEAASWPLSGWGWVAGISMSMSFLGFAVLGGMIMFMISKYILMGLISYLQWNVKFVLEK
jgi:uncharacterized membrane protein